MGTGEDVTIRELAETNRPTDWLQRPPRVRCIKAGRHHAEIARCVEVAQAGMEGADSIAAGLAETHRWYGMGTGGRDRLAAPVPINRDSPV